MLVRTSFMMAILAMLATPLWAQEGAPSGRQELAEQQRGQAQGGASQRGEDEGQGQQGQQRGEVQRGQAEPRPARGQRQPQGQAQQASGEVDHRQVAQMFILGNQAEVELGNLAAEKSQNAQVREFAEQMVKDHTAFIAKLKKFASADNEAAPRSGNTSASAQPSSGSHDAMANLQRKAAELELSMTKQMLSKHEGQDFDMGYLGQQMVAHTKMLACLTAAKDVGPQEFQTTLEEGITTTREHMQHAQQIAAAIKNKEYGEGQGSRPALREAQRPDGVIRNGQTRDGGARPAVRPQNSDAPREGAPQRGTPRVNPSGDREQTDGAPDSARDREESTP